MTEKHDEKTVAEAHDGADLTEFKLSNAGRYLYKQAEIDEMAALRKLGAVSPDDRDAIYRHQLAAAVPKLALAWIENAIQVGRNAKSEIELAEGEAIGY